MKQLVLIIGGLLVIVGIGVVILVVSGGEPEITEQKSTSSVNTKLAKAPSFVFKNYEGEEVSSESFLGKPHILNSWAVWCPFCVKELRDFVKLQEEFSEDITVVAINRAESLSKAKKYTDDLGTTNSMLFLMDPGDKFYKAIGGFSMPETLFVNAEGEIVRHRRGFMDFAEMQQAVHDLFDL